MIYIKVDIIYKVNILYPFSRYYFVDPVSFSITINYLTIEY